MYFQKGSLAGALSKCRAVMGGETDKAKWRPEGKGPLMQVRVVVSCCGHRGLWKRLQQQKGGDRAWEEGKQE